LAYALDGRRIASGAAGLFGPFSIQVWDTSDGSPVLCLKSDSPPASVAFSPDGRRIASQLEARDGGATVFVWDAQTGERLEVIEGNGNIAALAAGPPRFPWRALGRSLEIAIEAAATGKAVAWFPAPAAEFKTHPAGRTWAATGASQFYLFTLEGAV
jgi:WD40 repeat protein